MTTDRIAKLIRICTEEEARAAILAHANRQREIGRQEERGRIADWLDEWAEWYSTDIFSDPPPAKSLTKEQANTRTLDSAAMGRYLLAAIVRDLRTGRLPWEIGELDYLADEKGTTP
ncbi:MAG: hypothetical protein GY926_19555 [bacterium]|nr:hypothetical protein [bacterium]